jgi:hypothetical protein
MSVFWDVAPHSPVDTYRRFRYAYCLARHSVLWWPQITPLRRRSISTRLHGATTTRHLATVRSWNLSLTTRVYYCNLSLYINPQTSLSSYDITYTAVSLQAPSTSTAVLPQYYPHYSSITKIHCRSHHQIVYFKATEDLTHPLTARLEVNQWGVASFAMLRVLSCLQ